MTPLTLHRKTSHVQRIDLDQIVPERLQHLSPAAIGALPIAVDHRSVPLASEFEIRDGHRDGLRLSGDLRACDRIAGGMRSGELQAEGSVGDFLAADMRGGRLIVSGDAGNYAASSLAGGRVQVLGNVGAYAAAAAPGSSRGMSGGELIIIGNADQWLASRMRRGLVIVHGNVEPGCASRMIAGTLAVCGRFALPAGYAMKRGTILLLNPPETLLVTGLAGFTPPVACELTFLPILLSELKPLLPSELALSLESSHWRRCMGDRAERGLGELLLRESPQARASSLVSHS